MPRRTWTGVVAQYGSMAVWLDSRAGARERDRYIRKHVVWHCDWICKHTWRSLLAARRIDGTIYCVLLTAGPFFVMFIEIRIQQIERMIGPV